MKTKKQTSPPIDDASDDQEPCSTGGTRKWVHSTDRKRIGKQLLAAYLAQGIPVQEAIELTKLHPDLTSEKGRQPHHRTVVKWYAECTFAEEVAPDAPVEDLRNALRKRFQTKIARWEAQSVAVAEHLEAGQELDVRSKIHAEIAKCENQQLEYLKLLVRITHLDKAPPLERLDDGEIRQQLLQHVTASIRSFSVDELDEWLERLSAARERASVVYEGEESEAPSDELEDLGIS